MNLQFGGSLVKQEFKDSIQLMNHRILKKSGFHFDLWIVLIASGIGVLLLGLRFLFVDKNLSSGTFVLAIGGVLLSYGMKLRNAIDRAWEKSQKSDTRREGNITDEYIEIRNATTNLKILWSGFEGYGEYHEIILLFQGNVAHPFSSRFFKTNEEWQEFRKFVAGKLPVTHQVPQKLITINASNWYVWLIIALSIMLIIFSLFTEGSQ